MEDPLDLDALFEPAARAPAALYLVSPLEAGGDFPERLERALAGGPVAAFQFRVKGLDQHEAARLAEPLQLICEANEVAFIVNDDMALAKRLGADGVHLGQGDGDPREARALLGPSAQIGVNRWPERWATVALSFFRFAAVFFKDCFAFRSCVAVCAWNAARNRGSHTRAAAARASRTRAMRIGPTIEPTNGRGVVGRRRRKRVRPEGLTLGPTALVALLGPRLRGLVALFLRQFLVLRSAVFRGAGALLCGSLAS